MESISATNEYQLAMMEEENEELKSENEELKSENSKLSEKLTIITNCLSEAENEKDKLQLEIRRLVNTLADTKSLLQRETKLRKNNDNKLRKSLSSNESEPTFDNNLTNMENTLKKTNNENIASLKTFLTEQVAKIENNLKEMVEAKLGENKKEMTVLSENISKVSIPPTDVDPAANTWSSVVSRKQPNVTTIRNAELVEKQEQEKRKNNFIIYRLSETQGDNTNLQENDKILMQSFFQTIEVGVTPKQVMRLGRKEGEKNRLLKVVMLNSDDKEKVMSNLNKLKNANENLRCISVREDYTQEERNLLKAMNDEAKKKNEQDNVTHWKVRGSPKNGLRVVKITTRKQQES